MKLNQKFIQQLRNDQIAAENNGTLEQLREVLKAAFPKDVMPFGDSHYYSRAEINTDRWTAYSFKDKSKPTVKISNFYQPELFTGWAKDDRFPEWMMYFEDDVPKYGFDGCEYEWISGVRMYISRYSEIEYNRPANHEEIEQGLAEEAKRRGYKKGVTCFHASENYKTTLASNDIEYFISRKGYGVLVMGGYTIFSEKDGQWAEIIEKPQPKPKPQPKKSTTINHLKEMESPLALRDYFAAKAMQGLIANPNVKRPHPENGEMPPQYGSFVRIAYEYADAMLQERNETDNLPSEIKQERDEILEILKGLVCDVGNLIQEEDIEWQQAGYFNAAKELINKIKDNE